MSYVQLFIHAIIRTYKSEYTLPTDACIQSLYKEIWGIIKSKGGYLYRINSVEEHVHILFTMPPTLSLSDFMQAIKGTSSKNIKSVKGFEKFKGWGEGYAALSWNIGNKHQIIRYIINQQIHHKKTTFKDEYLSFIQEMGLDFDERDWNR